ncbi:MAG: lamin tail domain-containing protein [bacterium]
MRTLVVFCCILSALGLKGQVFDNFSDGDFTQNPEWAGDSLHFEVNGVGQLHLQSADVDTSWLATSCGRFFDTEWKFWMKLSFNSSTNNYARVYLTADRKELDQPLYGYFIQAGGADDSIRFMKQTGSVINSLFCFPDYTTGHSSNEIRFKIIRDTTDTWTMWVDSTGKADYLQEGSIVENSIQQSGWMGVWCKYTSSNATRFYFDDFYAGPVIPDTLPPASSYSARAFDVLIHEIMYDAEPSAGLPAAEFVELYNRTDSAIALKDWLFEYGTSRKTFPLVMLAPGGYLLISGDTLLATYGPVVSLFTSGASLSNEGTRLTLRNDRNQVIHSVEYNPGWFQGSWKEEGGWSLEMVDSTNPCGCEENWKPSIDPTGGTPGRENSVKGTHPDLTPPEAVRSYFTDLNTWEVLFTETLDSTSIGLPDTWLLEPGETHPDTLYPLAPSYRSLRLVFPGDFTAGLLYTLTGQGNLADCAGNRRSQTMVTHSAIPESMEQGNVVINEILSHPYPGSSQFFELFNRSEKVVDLEELAVISADTGESVPSTGARILASGPYLMFPWDFVAVCESEGGVKEKYTTLNTYNFLEMESFPSMKNDEGQLILIRSRDDLVIDRILYQQEMHYPLLTSTEGISLERISPDKSSLDPSNWHSAAGSVGYATPAYQNSQSLDPGIETDIISVISMVFSPDNDGIDDVLAIQYNMNKTGYQASVVVFDFRGREIRQLASNSLVGQSGEFLWDGLTGERRKAPIGIYLIYLEFVHPEGEIKKFKKAIVLAGHI